MIRGMKSITSTDISLICWILWYVWKQRNKKVFNHLEPNPIAVIDQANRSNAEFWSHCQKKQQVAGDLGRSDVRSDHWTPLLLDIAK